jgi:hypothetical protein
LPGSCAGISDIEETNVFEWSKIARKALDVDPAHDNRHKLDAGLTARESIPYMINLPDEGIAGFIYTWVNGASEAGAVLALFGPTLGEQPIQCKIADRPVPVGMDFANWQIDGFSMSQDLKFGHADIEWKSEGISLNLAYDAFHPPYAYGANADGCPSYTATNRIEQSGYLKGQIVIAGRAIPVNSLGHRDHSWGTRDWGAFQHYNWFEGQTADGVSVHFWRFVALGRINLRGYVFKDGLLAEVTNVQIALKYTDDLWHQSLNATISDEAGRITTVEAEFYARYTLVPSPLLSLRESPARAIFDGKPGLGWMEVAWPPTYLDYVAAHGPY